ncbi:hypothetical protein N9J88_05060 [Porticoccaceae bacterium]|nr:hypothetical protein [Porticoccaceae bacterium]
MKKVILVAFFLILSLSFAMNVAMFVSTTFFKLATSSFEAITNRPSASSKVHPKNSLVKFKGKTVRVAAAVASTTGSIKRRSVRTSVRSIGSMAIEAIPYLGVAAIVGVTAWELKELCETVKDIEALNLALNPDSEKRDDQHSVCSLKIPTKDQLLQNGSATSEELGNKVKSYLSELKTE